MTNEEIRELIQLVMDSGVAELEVQRGENRVRIRRAVAPGDHAARRPRCNASSHRDNRGRTIRARPRGRRADPAANEIIVKSPIVGTFYESPKPSDPPFVKVGDAVEPGQVLCIIESMKLMNEIESEVAGTIVAKLMENGRAVEYGEALFAIRPR